MVFFTFWKKTKAFFVSKRFKLRKRADLGKAFIYQKKEIYLDK